MTIFIVYQDIHMVTSSKRKIWHCINMLHPVFPLAQTQARPKPSPSSYGPVSVSNVMHNEAHFYCSSSERTKCGKPEETHSQRRWGTIDPDLWPSGGEGAWNGNFLLPQYFIQVLSKTLILLCFSPQTGS